MPTPYRPDPARATRLGAVLRAAAGAIDAHDRLARRQAEDALDRRERRWLRDALAVAERAVLEAAR